MDRSSNIILVPARPANKAARSAGTASPPAGAFVRWCGILNAGAQALALQGAELVQGSVAPLTQAARHIGLVVAGAVLWTGIRLVPL